MAEAKLTVLQVLPALQSGGVERGTLEIAAALVNAGHRALVMSAGGRMVEELQALGAEHFTWPIGNKSLLALRLVTPLRCFLAEQKVDILHVRSRFPAWIAYLAWRRMDPGRRPRFITTVHGLYSVNAYSRIMTRGEAIIAVSATVRDYLLQHYPDIVPERIEVIHRGVSGAAYPYGYRPAEAWKSAFFRQYPEAAGKQLLTLPGRVTRLKGHEAFIEILAELVREGRPVHGLIAGGASGSKQRYLVELQKMVRALGLAGHITFTGQRQDLKDILAISHLVLSLSSQPESFGRTTLEALRLGVPVAGYNHGGVGEILRSVYPAGCLPLHDRDAGLAKIRSLLDGAPAVPAGNFFPLAAMLERTLDLYARLANSPSSPHPRPLSPQAERGEEDTPAPTSERGEPPSPPRRGRGPG
ncbi:MAG: glycosyltransferase family 4 protein [Thiobacillaceae bacterium]